MIYRCFHIRFPPGLRSRVDREGGSRRIALVLGLGVLSVVILERGLAPQEDVYAAEPIPPTLSTGMGATATQPYRYETLYDGTVTVSLAMPIHKDDGRLIGVMMEVLRKVYEISADTDLAASVKHAEATGSWRFSDERYFYWVVPLPIGSRQVEHLSLRRLSSP